MVQVLHRASLSFWCAGLPDNRTFGRSGTRYSEEPCAAEHRENPTAPASRRCAGREGKSSPLAPAPAFPSCGRPAARPAPTVVTAHKSAEPQVVAEEQDQPLSPNEAALFAALSAIIQATPGGPQRKMLAVLLNASRKDFLVQGEPQSAALVGLLATAAETGPS